MKGVSAGVRGAPLPADTPADVFAESLAPVENRLIRESAAALLEMPANPRIQARVDELADMCNEGRITPAERSEYDALTWEQALKAMENPLDKRTANRCTARTPGSSNATPPDTAIPQPIPQPLRT